MSLPAEPSPLLPSPPSSSRRSLPRNHDAPGQQAERPLRRTRCRSPPPSPAARSPPPPVPPIPAFVLAAHRTFTRQPSPSSIPNVALDCPGEDKDKLGRMHFFGAGKTVTYST